MKQHGESCFRRLFSLVRRGRRFALYAGIIALILIALIHSYYSGYTTGSTMNKTALTRPIKVTRDANHENIPACKLPELDPYHKDIISSMVNYDRLRCYGSQHSKLRNGILNIALHSWENIRASYRKITRAKRKNESDFKVELGKEIPIGGNASSSTTISVPVSSEFIEVSIHNAENDQTQKEVHMQIVRKEDIASRPVSLGDLPVNVFFIILESTSAAQFQRKLKRTRQYLIEHGHTLFFKGEGIVGDGTTAQLSALLTGMPEYQQTEARKGEPGAQTVDGWNWIFRDFVKHGYATMHSEDDPSLGAFNLRLKGFHEPPTDHYARPFWIHVDETIVQETDNKRCVGNQAIHKISLNYLEDFVNAYWDRPKFGVVFFSYLTHNDENALGYADKDLVELFSNLERDSHLNNSMVFIMGDHGIRFGEWRKTMHGKLEERLPHLSLTLPPWFAFNFPDLYSNLKSNSEVLTSPLDLYATLRHILSYPKQPTGIRVGQSLLNRIEPSSRTCASAGIDRHWCPCLTWEREDVRQPIAGIIANRIVKFINELTVKGSKTLNLCEKLKLTEIKSLSKQMPNIKVQTFIKTKKNDICDSCGTVHGRKARDSMSEGGYQVQFVVSPGDGMFEASVRLKDGELVVDQRFISRINSYGDQSYCVKDQPHLLKFCYCR